MRINLTKKEIINSIYMQLGFSKKICENLLEDFFLIFLEELINYKKVKISNFGTFIIREKKSRPGINFQTKEKKSSSKFSQTFFEKPNCI